MPKHRSRYRPATGFSAPTGGTTIVVDKLAGGGSGTKADRCRALHTDGNTLVKWAQADEASGDLASPLADAQLAGQLFDQARKEGCPGT